MSIPWSDEEIEHLRKNAGIKTRQDLRAELKPISAMIGVVRTQSGIYKKMLKMGLDYTLNGKHSWKPHEIKYLEKHYGKKPTKELADRYGVTPKSIVMAAHLYGISGDSPTRGRPRKGEMLRETPWKPRLMDIYAVALWFHEKEMEIDIRNRGGLMAIYRRDTPGYSDPPMALYERFLKEGKLGGELPINVFEGERRQCFAGFQNFNVHDMGHAINYEY